MTPKEEEEILDADPSVLQEQEFKFSLAPDVYKFFVGGLGITNLGGRRSPLSWQHIESICFVRGPTPFLFGFDTISLPVPIGLHIYLQCNSTGPKLLDRFPK
jgi:hypothetical protein